MQPSRKQCTNGTQNPNFGLKIGVNQLYYPPPLRLLISVYFIFITKITWF